MYINRLEGSSLVKRKDVAALAGVSEATVSRVLNNVGPIREETKRRVMIAAKQLNYQPNALARSFATGKSGNIGIIVPYLPKVHLLSTYYFSEIISGIGAKLGEYDYNLLLIFQTPNEPEDYVQLFHSQRIDGCIILGARNNDKEKHEIERLHQSEYPYCLVNQTFDEHPFHSIDAAHYEGSFGAVSHLIEKGFKDIAFLNGPLEFSNSAERLHGYKDALEKSNIRFNSNWVFQGNYSRTSGLKIAKEMKQIMHDIDAIFAGNDRMAIGVMQGLAELGFFVGQDYALIGYDDSDVATMTQPRLSSIKVPFFEMGQIAAKYMINKLIKGDAELPKDRLHVTLIERTSTKQFIRR